MCVPGRIPPGQGNPTKKKRVFLKGKRQYLKSFGNQELDFLRAMPALVPRDVLRILALRSYSSSSANTVMAAIGDVELLTHLHFAFAYGCFFRHGLGFFGGMAVLALMWLWIMRFTA